MVHRNFILDFISKNKGVTQEYPLLIYIEKENPDFFKSLGAAPSLFKKHFWLFHQLYLLNNELIDSNQRLIISTLEIKLYDIEQVGTSIGETDGIQDFYLEKENLYLSDEEVIQMQKKFWEKYLAIDKKSEAIKILELETHSELNLKSLKKRYNELAKKHHPDKGGDPSRFIQIKNAYANLKQILPKK